MIMMIIRVTIVTVTMVTNWQEEQSNRLPFEAIRQEISSINDNRSFQKAVTGYIRRVVEGTWGPWGYPVTPSWNER